MPHRPYLREPVLNSHVAFDSEYYLSIAVVGYDDPDVGEMHPADGSPDIPLNYAFMPLYPLVIRVVAAPLGAMGLESLAAATVAGVIVSLLAALAASLALFSLARRQLGDDGGLPRGRFPADLPDRLLPGPGLHRGAVPGAGYRLAGIPCRAVGRCWPPWRPCLPPWTRPIGVFLVLAIAVAMVEGLPDARRATVGAGGPGASSSPGGSCLLAPVGAYLALGDLLARQAFSVVQREYFGQQPLAFGESWENWLAVLDGLVDRPAGNARLLLP